MATVYQSGQPIPIYQGKIDGGISVLFQKPEELTYLQAICLLAPHAPEAPLESIYKAIADPKLDFTRWFNWWEKTKGTRSNDLGFFIRQLEPDVQPFYNILADVQKAWKKQLESKEEISVIVSMTSPDDEVALKFESVDPALIIYQGSIRFVLQYPGKVLNLVTKFAVTIISKTVFATVESRNHDIYFRELRKSQETEDNALDVLDDQTLESVSNKSIIVIFIHGLLSTDLGTFDRLVKHLKLMNLCPIGLYGWPHDTLISIDENARNLSNIIGNKIFKNSAYPIPKIIFIAHSRGGLVARATAVKLYDRADKYKESIQHLFTFGTPHEGSELVEKPAEFKALFVTYQFFKIVGALPGFSKLLQTLGKPEEYPGILDLSPRSASHKGFIHQLCDREEDQVKGEDKARLLKIYAVGGIVQENADNKNMINFISNAMADTNHDLAVRTVSSISKEIDLENYWEWKCDHFSYFSEEQSSQFGVISDFIKVECERLMKEKFNEISTGLKKPIKFKKRTLILKQHSSNESKADEKNEI